MRVPRLCPRTWRKKNGSLFTLSDASPFFSGSAPLVGRLEPSPTDDPDAFCYRVTLFLPGPLGGELDARIRFDELSAEDQKYVRRHFKLAARSCRLAVCDADDAATLDGRSTPSLYRQIIESQTSAPARPATLLRKPLVATVAELRAAVETAAELRAAAQTAETAPVEIVLAPGIYLLEEPLNVASLNIALIGATGVRDDVKIVGPQSPVPDEEPNEEPDFESQLGIDEEFRDLDDPYPDPFQDEVWNDYPPTICVDSSDAAPATSLRLENLTLEGVGDALEFRGTRLVAINCAIRGHVPLDLFCDEVVLQNSLIVSEDVRERSAITSLQIKTFEAEDCQILGAVELDFERRVSLKNCVVSGCGGLQGLRLDPRQESAQCEIVGCQIGDCGEALTISEPCDALVRDATLRRGALFSGPLSEFTDFEPNLCDEESSCGLISCNGGTTTLENVRFCDYPVAAKFYDRGRFFFKNVEFENVGAKWSLHFSKRFLHYNFPCEAPFGARILDLSEGELSEYALDADDADVKDAPFVLEVR
ncbi:MAG: hypothetical protein IKW13_00550 [Thermoguttaceae bacterium]|nr:hypothetical protein [Thermoguttaceae bacterium]